MAQARWTKTLMFGIAVAAAAPGIGVAQIADRGTLPGGASCSASGVNSRGTSIGVCSGSHASGGHAVGVFQLFGDVAPTPLPPLAAGRVCSPTAISDTSATDFVAGSCEDAGGNSRAVRWTANAQGRFVAAPQVLAPLQGLLGLGADIEATVASINAFGAVVGDSIGVDGHHRAAIWRAGSTAAAQLPDPPVPLLATVGRCTAGAINNTASPKATGTCEVVNGTSVANVAVRWTAGSGGFFSAAVLGDIGGSYCGALDINSLGDTVGLCADAAGDATAVLWAADTTAAFIIVAADQSMVAGINDARVVAGSYVTDDGYLHGYVGTPLSSPTLSDIGMLPGGHSCGVVGLDAAGNVTATCDTGGLPALATRYTAATGLVALGTLGGTYSAPAGISSGGTLVGNSTTVDGFGHAFILAPPAIAARQIATPSLMVPVSGRSAHAADRHAKSTGAIASDDSRCPTWIANGFLSSSFYTETVKHQFCPSAFASYRKNASPPQPKPTDDPRCPSWAANGFLASTFYTEATKRQYCASYAPST